MEQVREDMHHRLLKLVDDAITAIRTSLQSSYSDPKRLQAYLNVLKLVGFERVLHTTATTASRNHAIASTPIPSPHPEKTAAKAMCSDELLSLLRQYDEDSFPFMKTANPTKTEPNMTAL